MVTVSEIGMNDLRDLLLCRQPQKRRILAAAPGSGLMARVAAESGADFLMVLSAGAYRQAGVGSLASLLPFANSNLLTEQLLREEILPRVGTLPAVAGVFAADETIDLERHLRHLQRLGAAGVVNWPAIGFIDGTLRHCLEEADCGIAIEAEMLGRARAMGLVTIGFALSVDAALAFVEAGVDALILDVGLTADVLDAAAKRDRLQQAIARLAEMTAAVRGGQHRPACLCFGGPITTEEDVEQVFRAVPLDGMAGGSVFERLPVEASVASKLRRFRSAMEPPHESSPTGGLGSLVGTSAGMVEVFGLVRRVARHDVSVLIEGDTGTGKELVAGEIHRLSRRVGRPFITLNCGAIPDGLLESELFGHEKGSFTGADRRRIGKFEIAQGGTLFLDEVADLSPRGQVALLRVLQQQEITRVGGDHVIAVDVRIVVASNRPLLELAREAGFRTDLYYRLAAVTIRIPPLRDRPGDLPALVMHLIERLAVEHDRPPARPTAEFLDRLANHAWPGNVRELEQVLREAVIREDGPHLEGRFFRPSCRIPGPDRQPHAAACQPSNMPTSERRLIAENAVQQARGNKSRAAVRLGITRKTLYAWLREERPGG